ncbi:MAG: TlpA disulfide reductase family protein [Thermoanaerobaculia bacterium]
MKRIVTILATLSLPWILVAGCARRETPVQAPASPTANAAADVAPEAPSVTGAPQGVTAATLSDWHANKLDGGTFQVADMKGQVVLLNVWATWCPPCRQEVPDLIRLQKQFGEKGLKVVGVSVDDGKDMEDVRKFVSNYAINYPVVLDPTSEIANKLQSTVIPISVLLDKEGRMVWYQQGSIIAGDPQLLSAIERTLTAS